jgi:hypothetical protein
MGSQPHIGRKFTSDAAPAAWQDAFLDHYREFGGITLSAKTAGVTVPYVKRHAAEDPEFAERFDEAKEIHADTLEKLLVLMARGRRNPADSWR